jgi:hypothetical protein
MNIQRKLLFSIVIITAWIAMALTGVCRADDKVRDRKTLHGIESVVVIVHAVEAEWQSELAKVGLAENVLQASIERQLVSLKRDPAAEAFSITWQTESVGLRRLALIKEDIKSLVDVFVEAYASENPELIKR